MKGNKNTHLIAPRVKFRVCSRRCSMILGIPLKLNLFVKNESNFLPRLRYWIDKITQPPSVSPIPRNKLEIAVYCLFSGFANILMHLIYKRPKKRD
jgi:hypothetical protein